MSRVSRPMILLGAGASMRAGIPGSVGLTADLLRTINDDAPRGRLGGTDARALNLVYTRLLSAAVDAGGSPDDGIDVERLFSAVRMLAERSNLEITPFVRQWDPGLDALGPAPDAARWDSSFRVAVMGREDLRPGRRTYTGVGSPIEMVRRAVRAGTTVGQDDERSFGRLADSLIAALRARLALGPDADLGDLEPIVDLAERGPVSVATLNYDLALETLAERRGVTVSTGFAEWAETGLIGPTATVGIDLLKLHGSVDWHREREHRLSGMAPSLGGYRYYSGEAETQNRSNAPEPVLVFGLREKLRHDGPFLPMLTAFRERLDGHEHLVVVGYSFRDDHVNEAIRSWIRADESRVITVVDRAFMPESRRDSRPRTDARFAGELRSLQAERVQTRKGDGPVQMEVRGVDRLFILETEARVGLPQALSPWL